MHVREFRPGDEPALHAVFYSAVHQLTVGQYTAEQRQAWAPGEFDPAAWEKRMRGIRPFVAECEGRILGYADLQPSGLIDHFFVAASAAGRGVGRLLMERIHARAAEWGIPVLFSEVSLTAEPFFLHFGFRVCERREVVIQGVTLANAHMRKELGSRAAVGD